MATRISYSAKDKKRADAGWNGRGKGSAAIRAIKMIRPICEECQAGLDTVANWFETCEHEPYWSLRSKVINTPVYDTDEDGDMILSRTDTRTKMIRVPNITEVVVSARQNDGQGVQKARAKGFVLVTDLDLAPICEMYGCGRSFPTVRTDYGDFCNDNHAKLVVADITEVKFTVNDPAVYRKELQGVVI